MPENEAAVEFLIRKVFAGSKHRLIIAGMNPQKRIIELAHPHNNISIIANPDDEKLFSLIRNAHVNVLVTFQATGLKLKLLNTLYNGRHCLVNPLMLNGTGLEPLCTIAETAEDFRNKLDELQNVPFTVSEAEKRHELLNRTFSNSGNAARLSEAVFGS